MHYVVRALRDRYVRGTQSGSEGFRRVYGYAGSHACHGAPSPQPAAALRVLAPYVKKHAAVPGYEETLYFQQTFAGEAGAFAGLMTHHHGVIERAHHYLRFQIANLPSG